MIIEEVKINEEVKNTFIFPMIFFEAAEELTYAQRVIFHYSLINYITKGEVVKLEGGMKALFILAKKLLDEGIK